MINFLYIRKLLHSLYKVEDRYNIYFSMIIIKFFNRDRVDKLIF